MASITDDRRDRQDYPKDISLSGKWLPNIDPTLIGESDFATLQNLRYTNTNPRGVSGMTAINTTPTPQTNIVNGIFFQKQGPFETHAVFQTYNSTYNATNLITNDGLPPNATEFNPTPIYVLATMWASGTAYNRDDIVFSITSNPNIYFQCSIAGISGGSEPATWTAKTTSEYNTTTDGTVQWVTRIGSLMGSFSMAPNGYMTFLNGAHSLIWGGNESNIGSFLNQLSTGYLDYTTAMQTDSTEPEYIATLQQYSSGVTYVYVGTILPANGVKFYVEVPSSTTSAVSVKYWNGSAWTAVTNLVDGTSVGGASLAQTGWITFDSPVGKSATNFIMNLMEYWLQFEWTTLPATTKLYYATAAIPVQSIQDVWDGSPYQIAMCNLYGSSDQTPNVLKVDALYTAVGVNEWDVAPNTIMDISSLADTASFFVGFTEPVCGLYFLLTSYNSNAATVSIDYWNGASWTTVGGVQDSTNVNGEALGSNGYMTWNPIPRGTEFTYNLGTLDSYYYCYKVTFSSVLSSSVQVDYISGIKSPIDVTGYNFSVLWLDSIWLCGKKSGDKNRIVSSLQGTATSFGSQQSFTTKLGKNTELVSGCTLFSRYGSDVAQTMILHKIDETWMLNGTDQSNITSIRISDDYGNTAKNTLKVCDLGYEIAPGINKNVAIWQSQQGIIMFDNSAFMTISNDLDSFFLYKEDTTRTTTRLNATYESNSYGFYDPTFKEYHWCFTDGSSTTVNREFVFDILRKKWFEIVRGSGKVIRSAITVADSTGGSYVYGADYSGYIYRTEYGNTFGGNDIVYTVATADKPLYTTMLWKTVLRYIKFMCKSFDTSGMLQCWYYADHTLTPELLWEVNPYDSTVRIFKKGLSLAKKAVFHQFKFVMTTNDISIGFEPLALSLFTKADHRDVGYLKE